MDRFRPFLRPLADTTPPSPLEEVIRVLPGPARQYACLTDRYEAFLTHFIDGRTFPCLGVHHGCTADHSKTTLRWQAWLAVQPLGKRSICYVGLTEAGVRDCPDLCAAQGSLRGRILLIGRAGETVRGRMRVSFSPQVVEDGKLLPAPSIVQFLEKLWRKSMERQMVERDCRRQAGKDGDK